MKISVVLIFLFLLNISCSSDTIHIIHLSDVHGHYYPYDYIKDKPGSPSLVNVFYFVDSLRKAGDQVYVIDTGDLIQGTPMSYYFNKIDTTVVNPADIAYNHMGLSVFVVGNHDIEQGPMVYRKVFNDFNAPVLSANAVLPSGKAAFTPYTFLNDRQIALIGMTTPAIPLWLTHEHYPDIHWQGLIKTMGAYFTILKKTSPFLIAGVHAGIDSTAQLEATQSKGLPRENNVLGLIEAYPGIDLILCGHEHRIIPGKYFQNKESGTQLSMPGHGAAFFNHIIISDNKVNSIDVLKTSNYPPHEKMLKALEPYHLKTLKYIHTPLFHLQRNLNMNDVYFFDNALLDFIQDVQIKETGAQISFAASFDPGAKLDSGIVRIKDIFTIYKYENYLYGIWMTGEQIDKYLEYSALIFTGSRKPILDPDIPGFNYDIGENLTYTIDITKKPGNRVMINRIDGKKISPHKKYRVAINSYRLNGGGGFMNAAGIMHPDIYYQSDEEIRNIIIKHVLAGEKITLKADNNYKLIGKPGFDKKVSEWIKSHFQDKMFKSFY